MILILSVWFLSTFLSVESQNYLYDPVRWCTISKPEFEKCNALAAELKYFKADLANTHKSIECIQRTSHDECMILLDQQQADIVNLDANEIFLGGRHHSLVPIMKEVYEENQESYYSVAVIKKNGNLSHINNINQLAGSVACFPSVSSMAGWIIPISTLIERNIMEVIDCNNHVKSASNFFRGGCAVNVLTNKYNPLGDNDLKLCSACGSEKQGVRCFTQDPFAGYVGALKCLVKDGEVAFVKHSTVQHTIASYNKSFPYTADDFELLCLDGRHTDISDYRNCNWGEVPSNAIATSSAKTQEQREALQEFLKVISQSFSERRNDPSSVSTFYLYESPLYGQGFDLLVSDDTKRLVEVVSTQQNFQVYLSKRVMNHIETVRSCPVQRAVLCVTDYPEYTKCLKMKTALEAQLLKPPLECMNGNSQVGCMVAIQKGQADISLFEAGDIYTAGLKYELIPIMAEQYNLDSTHYYVVAVSQEDDTDTDIVYLKGRYTCHPSIMHGGGWVLPMAYLLNNELIRGYGCDSVRAASEYFVKSCAPGAMSSIFNYGQDRLNLCHLCRGTLTSFCARDHTEPFYGFTGAFRCLVEGGGNVAFLKHTTVAENTNGRRLQWWARNTLTVDYQLLCRDGTRMGVSDYESCHLGKVRSNAVVTRGGYERNETEILAFTNLLLYAQQLFGSDFEDDWKDCIISVDPPKVAALTWPGGLRVPRNQLAVLSGTSFLGRITQDGEATGEDATQQLVPLLKEEQHYHPYLGREFLNARYRVDCTAAATSIYISSFALCLALVVPAIVYN